jgi:hypothetical protein
VAFSGVGGGGGVCSRNEVLELFEDTGAYSVQALEQNDEEDRVLVGDGP